MIRSKEDKQSINTTNETVSASCLGKKKVCLAKWDDIFPRKNFNQTHSRRLKRNQSDFTLLFAGQIFRPLEQSLKNVSKWTKGNLIRKSCSSMLINYANVFEHLAEKSFTRVLYALRIFKLYRHRKEI